MKTKIEKKITMAKADYDEAKESLIKNININIANALEWSNTAIRTEEIYKLWVNAQRVFEYADNNKIEPRKEILEWLEKETSQKLNNGRNNSSCPVSNGVKQYQFEAFSLFRRDLQMMLILA